MGNALMTSDNMANPVFTDISMALLEDSGWYKVDYNKAETFTFGKNSGCDFLTKPCMTTKGDPAFPEFCKPDPKGQPILGCSADYMSPAAC